MTADLKAGSPKAASVPIEVNSDPVDWPQTPKRVAARLRRLRRERADARLVWRSIFDERQTVWDAKRTAEARLTSLIGATDSPWFVSRAHFEPLADDHPEVVATRQRLDDAKAEIERLNPIIAAREHQLDQVSRLLSSIEKYFERLRAIGTITLHDGLQPSLRKAEVPLDAVERCRRLLRELAADRHRIASAPWHAAQAKERARAEIDKWAARGEPSVLPLIESPEGSIHWRERPISDTIIAGRLISAQGDPPALPLMFWLHQDAIVAKVEAAIDAVADDAHALTVEQRTEQMQAIERDMLVVEREEEQWVATAISGGATILRRPDADPRAVLALGDDMPPP